jgi:uncharacterized protein (DUF433 family)
MAVAEKVIWVERKPTVCGGKPVIKGTRIPIGVLLGALADGMTVQEVADTYGIPPEAIEGALAFVAEQIADALMQPAKDVPLEQDVRRLLRTLAKRWL